MDPFSAAASCITILQLLGTAKSLSSTSRHALKNIDSIRTEVNSLQSILQDLDDQGYKSFRIVQAMIRCEKDLNPLCKKLEYINSSCDRIKRFKWFLVDEEVNRFLASVRGMRDNLLLAMSTSQLAMNTSQLIMNSSTSALLRELHQQMVLSNAIQQQHHLESAAGQRQLLSLMENTVVPRPLARYGYMASVNSIQSGCSKGPSQYSASGMSKWVFQFILFDLLIRTKGLRSCGSVIKDGKKHQQASSLLLRFKPSTLLVWLVETAVVLDISWGGAVGGLRMNPRYYVHVPDSHQLIKAAKTGNTSHVRELIDTDSGSALCMTEAGWTPLHFAAAKGHYDMCDDLISHGADVNAVGYIGMTPLHVAASFGQIQVMKLLITKGSDPNIFHDHGYHAIFQLFTTANNLEGAEKLALVDWVIRKQEYYAFNVLAVDVLHRNLCQVIIQSETNTSTPGALLQSRLVDALFTTNLPPDNQDFRGSTALHEAMKFGRLDIVEQLLDAFATPTMKDHKGRTPIHYAARLGNVAMVRRLLGDQGVGINDRDLNDWTPLRWAIRRDHIATVKLLISLHAHCDCDDLKLTVVYDAKDVFDFLLAIGVKPNAEVLESIITHGQDSHYLRSCILSGLSPNLSPDGFWTPLTLAAYFQRTAALKGFLSMGADVNLRRSDGSSALLIAVNNGNSEIVDILLRAGAVTHDPIIPEIETMNLISLATRKGYADIAEMLCTAGAPKPVAIPPNLSIGKNQTVNEDGALEPAEIQVRATSSRDMHDAAQENRVDILKEMISQGGDVNTLRYNRSSRYNRSPLESACLYGSSEAAIFLINAGADLHYSADKFYPPLFQAAERGLANVIQALIQKGADINQINVKGQTALLRMSEDYVHKQFTCITKQLISHGINVDAVDKDGSTALGLACSRGLTSVVATLLEAGANISIPSRPHPESSKIRYLPLELAAREGHEDIVQILLAKGANWRSLKHKKAIATSHLVLVRRWFADDDDEPTFLGCEPPEAQTKVSRAQDSQASDNANANHPPTRSNKQKQPGKTKKLTQFLIDSGSLLLTGFQWIESCLLHLSIGISAIIVVSLFLLHHKVPFSLIQRNWSILRVLLWAIALMYIKRVVWAWIYTTEF